MTRNTCPVCRRNKNNCDCQEICRDCWRSEEECVCSENSEDAALINPRPETEQTTSQVVAMADPGVLRVAGEPPNFAEVKGDRKKLGLYISALKRWSRVGGVPKKDQADTIIYHAHRTCNEYFEELESKFGTTLDESEEGTQKIIEYLEEKNGLSKHSEIVRIFNVFLNTKREKNENLVNFVQRFEKAYTDVQNLTTADQPKVMTMSATGKSIMMLVAAKLPDIDYQIITKGLDFDEKDKEKEKKVFDLTKKAMVDYQVTKMSNNWYATINTAMDHVSCTSHLNFGLPELRQGYHLRPRLN